MQSGGSELELGGTRRSLTRLSLGILVTFAAIGAGAALANGLPPGGSFSDDNGNIHEGNIEAIAAAEITKGCNPPVNSRYCPSAKVTRGQMAAFLVRALDLTEGAGSDLFVDDNDSIFENDIDRLGTAGITRGCNPPTNDRFCPDQIVTRGQMAAFLVRAFGYDEGGGSNLFTDDDGLVFEGDIDRLGTAGVTKGCNPPTNDRFCPAGSVLRDQMASFLARALELAPIQPPSIRTFGNGIWVISSDIQPGTYRMISDGSSCYWERLSGFGGTIDDIITNSFGFTTQIVEILPSDAGFNSSGCPAPWSNDPAPRRANPEANWTADGFLQVGTEIAPGTWRNSGLTGGCYWERLSGYSGELGDIISNSFSFNPSVVAISPTDIAFNSDDDCGTWTKIG